MPGEDLEPSKGGSKHRFSRILKRFRPEHSDNSAAAPGEVVAAAIAKWLVPSVSALFIVSGYAVVSAHQGFLGIENEGAGTSDYIAAAASFLRDLLTILPESLLDALTWTRIPKFDILQTIFILVLFLACFALALTCRRSLRAGWFAVSALVALIFFKFILLDAPLTRIENVLVGSGTGQVEAKNTVPIETILASSAQRKGLDGFISKRALTLWFNMVCSRVSAQALGRYGKPKATCRYGQNESEFKVRSEFIAHSMASMLLLAMSIQVLRKARTPGVAMASLLTLGYVFTWPYAYGKLVKSTYYEYGAVLFGSSLADFDTPPDPEARIKHAIVVLHDSNSSKLLVVKTGKNDCPRGANSQEVKLWKIPNSQIVAIREIYREDVITWKILQERPCPQQKGPW